jgi:hypothetical protein
MRQGEIPMIAHCQGLWRIHIFEMGLLELSENVLTGRFFEVVGDNHFKIITDLHAQTFHGAVQHEKSVSPRDYYGKWMVYS